MQTTAFDSSAGKYDEEFTRSAIGKMQRDLVHAYLKSQINSLSSNLVLEINCGTGADALWLSQMGMNVSASDASQRMIELAEKKINPENQGKLNFKQAAFSAIDTAYAGKNFDFIFSNFGGLNCIDEQELAACLRSLGRHLDKGGKIILVLMSRNCWWEKLYFLLKGNLKQMRRRNSKTAVAAHLGDGVYQATYFYSPDELRRLAGNDFDLIAVRPIGFFIPPSYLEPFFANKKFLLRILGKLEGLVKNLSGLANLADHYLIHLEKK